MKKNVLVIPAMIISAVMFAQGQGNRTFGPRPGSNAFGDDLGISEPQRKAMQGINKKYATKQADAVKSLREQQEKELTALLTPEQKTKREQLVRERNEQRKQMQAKSVADHDARMKSDLLLSDEQAGKLHNEDAAFRTKMQALRKDVSSNNRDQVKKIRSEHEAAVQRILNDEQFKKWSSLNGPQQGRFTGQRAYGTQSRFHGNDFNDQKPGRNHHGPQRDRGHHGPRPGDGVQEYYPKRG